MHARNLSLCLLLVLGAVPSCGDSDSGEETALVIRCLDGDTAELEDGTKVRFLGVDTPEVSKNDCYALEAKYFTESLILNEEVILEPDANTDDTDQFGRLLRYVWIEVGDQRRLVNKELLLKGYARSFMDSKLTMKDELRAAEAQAQATGAGLWCACEDLPSCE
jgi:micrococcal nuclease